ncbi:transposase, partial [Bathymodiolus azoricus thioautotrophic gill symbiont]|uniref:transposase n=1 Tax=Bathymodiolus azoricus thioautotrophic gill symbiont TaxID=235205 RepID=UPI00192A7651
AQWTYKKHKGYMPIIGHIAQTGQIVATNFRTGNVSPAKDNLDFIKISQDALPKGTNIKKLRIDAAGYQASIIDYCFEHDIEFSIRAKICQSLKDIFVDKDNQWQPLVDKKGKAIDGQATFRMRHFIGRCVCLIIGMSKFKVHLYNIMLLLPHMFKTRNFMVIHYSNRLHISIDNSRSNKIHPLFF